MQQPSIFTDHGSSSTAGVELLWEISSNHHHGTKYNLNQMASKLKHF